MSLHSSKGREWVATCRHHCSTQLLELANHFGLRRFRAARALAMRKLRGSTCGMVPWTNNDSDVVRLVDWNDPRACCSHLRGIKRPHHVTPRAAAL